MTVVSGPPRPPTSAGDTPGPGLAERLERLLDRSVAAGPAGRPAGLMAATLPVTGVDPISLYAAALEADLETALWLQPSNGTAFVGIGRAWAVEADGPDRFRTAEAAWRELLRNGHRDSDQADGRGTGPILLGAMGFTGRRPAPDDVWAPFGPSSMVLPELLLSVTAAGATVTGSLVARHRTRGRSSASGSASSSVLAASRRVPTGSSRGLSSAPS